MDFQTVSYAICFTLITEIKNQRVRINIQSSEIIPTFSGRGSHGSGKSRIQNNIILGTFTSIWDAQYNLVRISYYRLTPFKLQAFKRAFKVNLILATPRAHRGGVGDDY